MGLTYLSTRSISETFQPLLDELAQKSSELVRLGLIENEKIIWIGKAQGSRSGLKYDPDSGNIAYLPASACGLAYLASLSEYDFKRVVEREGFEKARHFGPNTPQNLEELQQKVSLSRQRGYGLVSDTYEIGLTAIAKMINNPQTGKPFGTISIAGPSFRLDSHQIETLIPELINTAQEIEKIVYLTKS